MMMMMMILETINYVLRDKLNLSLSVIYKPFLLKSQNEIIDKLTS